MRLLLVDDEKDFVEPLAERLRLRGFATLTAHDAATALALLEREHPELAFLDVHLPGMDGVNLLRQVRELRPDLDVIMLSGATEMQTAVRAMRRGALNWLSKPVELETVLEECRKAGERRLQRKKDALLAEAALLGTLGRVAEGVAHEVNNPVNIMMQAAGWIGDLLEPHTLPESEEIRQALELIRTQSLRVRELTRRLLICGKGLDPGTEAVDVNAVLRQTLEMLEGRFHKQHVQVASALGMDMPKPLGSSLELQQVCAHVLENALDAMPEGGIVRVETTVINEGQDAACLLRISDTGPGIAPEHLPQVFEPFFSTKPGAQGLGLAVCRTLLHRRGGSIAVRNRPEGCCFEVTLPLEA